MIKNMLTSRESDTYLAIVNRQIMFPRETETFELYFQKCVYDLQGRTDGTKSQMASIQLLIELLVLHKDTRVKECQKQVSQLNKQLSELSQYADPVRNKELEKLVSAF